jgi:pyruvate/2-oxoglutarate dehydrogenase complex dihydrolipoamide dehydrogenase (E3) component
MEKGKRKKENLQKASIVKERSTGFDVVVIGGGSAGLSAAAAAREAGAKVALIEAGMMGGECPNYACVPTKSMLAAAVRYDDIRRNAAAFGIHAAKLQFDLASMMERKDAVVRAMTGGRRLEKILDAEGVTVIRGTAVFLDDESIRVGDRVISAKAFVIATGSVPAIPPVANIEAIDYWTPREVTSMKALPESVAVLGSGPIGAEFATFFSLIGVPTAVFDVSERMLPREDAEAGALAQKLLRDRGVVVHLKTKVLSVTKEKRGVRLTYQTGSAPRKTMHVDRVIVAAGRRPNLDGLMIEKAGVKRDDHGRVVLDGSLRAKGTQCFLAGDVTGLIPFTHTAHAGGVCVGANAAALAKKKKPSAKIDFSVVPYVIFVAPELATVGKTAEALAATKQQFTVWKFPVGALGRAVIERERTGVLKVFVEKKTGRILGATMLGDRAGEAIHELALAMYADVPFSKVQSMIHAYPTMSEAIPGLIPA